MSAGFGAVMVTVPSGVRSRLLNAAAASMHTPATTTKTPEIASYQGLKQRLKAGD